MNRFLSKKSKWLVLSYCFIFRKNRRKNTFKAAHHDKQTTNERCVENHVVKGVLKFGRGSIENLAGAGHSSVTVTQSQKKTKKNEYIFYILKFSFLG